MFRHIVPNLASSILVLATLHVGYSSCRAAPFVPRRSGSHRRTPSVGRYGGPMAGVDERSVVVSSSRASAILVTVLRCNILGDWVRDRSTRAASV